MKDGITFTATLNQIRTTPDGGWRITLDVGQDAIEQIKTLSTCRDQALQVAAVPFPEPNWLDKKPE